MLLEAYVEGLLVADDIRSIQLHVLTSRWIILFGSRVDLLEVLSSLLQVFPGAAAVPFWNCPGFTCSIDLLPLDCDFGLVDLVSLLPLHFIIVTYQGENSGEMQFQLDFMADLLEAYPEAVAMPCKEPYECCLPLQVAKATVVHLFQKNMI